MNLTRVPLIMSVLAVVAAPTFAQQTSQNNQMLKQALALYPEADANRDGVLTRQEAIAYRDKMGLGGPGKAAQPGDAAPLPADDARAFAVTAEELDKLMQAESARAGREPLSFPKGNGLRILMTGHSWVAPGRSALPQIAAAAGYVAHQQRAHISGGGTGSVISIWRKEVGKYDGPPRPILLPAIATGQWDVMTWGMFTTDTPEQFALWIDACLKHNPQMTFYIQDGWPRFTSEMKSMSREQALAAIAAQQKMIHAFCQPIYDALETRYPGKVRFIPAGDAIVKMLHLYYDGKLPGFDTVSEHLGGANGIYRDGGHMSRTSGTGHLIGYCYFAALYKRSPQTIQGYQPEGIPPEVDAILRRVAWEAVTQSPLSGLTDVNADGIADQLAAPATGTTQQGVIR